ncbi:MAG: hypothetical protein KatS3mg121_0010 [Gammaproteobacteria bacterium]|nr:MAG: hypothetical protein KatS3mg121_0010 [Gammaproteobacteria bacterium]
METGLRVASGPTVRGGLLFVGTSDGELAAYWSEDGRPAWRSRGSSEALSAPAVDAGIVVVHAVDGMIQAYDTRSGERLWTHSTSVPTLSLRGVGDPVATGGAVLCGTDDGRLVALGPARRAAAVRAAGGACPPATASCRGWWTSMSPPLVDGQVLYVAAYQGQVTVFDLARGANPWSRRASVYTPMALDGDSLYYVDEPGHVQALDRYSGDPRWRQEKLHARSDDGRGAGRRRRAGRRLRRLPARAWTAGTGA